MGDREGVTPMLLDFPYLKSDPDRHGNERLYIRRHDRKIRLRETPGTPAFITEYDTGLKSLEKAHRERTGSDCPAGR
jgi:hypothetical protein